MVKRLFAILFCLVCAFGARAGNNNTATSKNYVDTQVATLQDEIPAINSNTVLTHTGTSGEIGAKQIYDSNNDFVTQTDALVTAETFNTAVQNAIDTEFVCIDWLGEHVPGNCLLWKIQNKTPQQIVPDGYTALEYLESTGTQYIDIGIKADDFTETQIIGQYTALSRNATLFGVTKTNAEKYYGLGLATNGSQWRLWYGSGGAPWVVFGTSDMDKHTFMLKNKSVYFDNNSTPAAISELSTTAQPNNLLLFALYWKYEATYFAKAKIYSVKIYDNDTFVRNLVPAQRDSDGELGMYDTISGTFFTNSGTGTFIAGPDVSSNIYLPSGN